MAWRAARSVVIGGIVAAAAFAVGYAVSSTEIADLKLVSIDAMRLKNVAQLAGQGPPDTPVFIVRFTTRSDLVALANGLDAFAVRNQVLVGDGCNPALKTMSYARVAFMLMDFTAVFDAKGNVERRGWGASDESDEYVVHFGIIPSEMAEFVSSGLKEAPLCFALTGASRAGRNLSSNIVLLPMEALAEAAARLGS